MVPKNVLLALLVVISLTQFVKACYVTNCPWGGKRSVSDSNTFGAEPMNTHQCRKCADGQGTCFGPGVCCGKDIGCFLHTQETLVCRSEDVQSSRPCSTYGKSCDKLEYGKCATRHLCCNPETCVPDSKCQHDELQLVEIQDQETEDSNSENNNNETNSEREDRLISMLAKVLRKNAKKTPHNNKEDKK